MLRVEPLICVAVATGYVVAWYEAAFSPGPAKRSVKNGVAEASDEPSCRLTRSVTVTGAMEAAPTAVPAP